MDNILGLYYKGFRSKLYTLPEVLRVFHREGVYAEDLDGKGYDPKFLAALPSREKREISPLKKEVSLQPSKFIRHAVLADEPVLEELSDAFQRELYNKRDKEDFLGLDAFVLLSPSSEGKMQGALWYQGFEDVIKGAEFYIRSLYVRPEFRQFGAGKSLVQFACEQAEEQGYPRISVNSPDHRTSFYRSLGFRRQGSDRETEGCVYLVKKIEL